MFQAFQKYKTPLLMFEHMSLLTSNPPFKIHNYYGIIEEITNDSLIIETSLFSKEILEFYTKHNMNLINENTNPKEYEKFYNKERGGGQGDYSFGFKEKLENVLECLQKFPNSKRAVLTMPYAKKNSIEVKHYDDIEQKCLRELHFWIEGDKLYCSGFMRAQATIIFPKNIHFIGNIMLILAEKLKLDTGYYSHFVTHLVADRQ